MSRIKEVICICCPCGCHLQVDPENDYNVTGNAWPCNHTITGFFASGSRLCVQIFRY